MPNDSKPQQQKAQDQNQQRMNEQIRSDLSNAFAYVEGQKSVQSFSAFTIEDAHRHFIERVTVDQSSVRPCLLKRIDSIVNSVVSAVEKVKALPPEAFRRPNTEDVNTPVVYDEDGYMWDEEKEA